MQFLAYLLLHGLLAMVAAWLVPGVVIESYLAAIGVVLVLVLVNGFVRPVLTFLTLPITIITLGLFLIIIDGIMVLLADFFVPGFHVDGLLWAILFAFLLTLFNVIFGDYQSPRKAEA